VCINHGQGKGAGRERVGEKIESEGGKERERENTIRVCSHAN